MAHELTFKAREAPDGAEVLDAWLETELAEGWTAAFRLISQDGGFVVGELRIFPTIVDLPRSDHYPSGERKPGEWSAEYLGYKAPDVPTGGLRVRTVRALSFAEIRKAGRRLLALWARDAAQEDALFAPGGIFARHGLSAAELTKDRRGQRGHDDAFYAQLAAEYASAAVTSSSPVADLAAERSVSKSRLRQLLATARKRGLLTPTQPGVAGGQLTDKAREILGREEEERDG